jgi:hypothetical protein
VAHLCRALQHQGSIFNGIGLVQLLEAARPPPLIRG